MALRYRVTYLGKYLFHVYGADQRDALAEARRIAGRTMRDAVVTGLLVTPD